MGSYEVIYEPAAAAFIIRILGDASEQDVVACFRDYEATVERQPHRAGFNVVLNVDEAAHSSIAVLRLIRQSLENQRHRDRLVRIVGVSDNAAKVAMSRSGGGDLLLFADEAQAVSFLTEQAREDGLV